MPHIASSRIAFQLHMAAVAGPFASVHFDASRRKPFLAPLYRCGCARLCGRNRAAGGGICRDDGHRGNRHACPLRGQLVC